MHKEIKFTIWALTACLIWQVILVVLYQNYGARYIGDFTLFPAAWNNPEKMSASTYIQIGVTVVLLISFLLSRYFNKMAFKAFRLALIALLVFGLFTSNGIALASIFSIAIVNKVLAEMSFLD